MYDKTDKRRLYWLIDQYLSNNIDDDTFCSQFHDSFVNEMDYKILTESELDVFHKLSDVSQRFSEFEEDHKLWSGFITAKQLKEKVVETKEKLKEQKTLYDKIIRQKLYCFLDQYLSNRIDEVIFRDEFHNTFINEVYYDGLTSVEYVAFCNLDDISQCFTDSEECFKLWSGYITAKQLREKVLETKNRLKEKNLVDEFKC
ncbi:hypothetical protein AGMMS50262_24130 [Bacteroidia bacterium]|nr:hypothetical protein AGMMS50262_24130 [Bacteroidia bacterium]